MLSHRRVSTGSDTFLVIASPVFVRGYYITNANELGFRYVHFFDRASTAGGMAGVKWTVSLPLGSGSNVSWDNGLEFTTGLVMAFSTSPTSIAVVTSGQVVANVFYEEVP